MKNSEDPIRGAKNIGHAQAAIFGMITKCIYFVWLWEAGTRALGGAAALALLS